MESVFTSFVTKKNVQTVSNDFEGHIFMKDEMKMKNNKKYEEVE